MGVTPRVETDGVLTPCVSKVGSSSEKSSSGTLVVQQEVSVVFAGVCHKRIYHEDGTDLISAE